MYCYTNGVSRYQLDSLTLYLSYTRSYQLTFIYPYFCIQKYRFNYANGRPMYLDNCIVQFSGLTPSYSARAQIAQFMKRLIGTAPSDSSFKLCMVVGENEVDGFLTVVSSKIRFESSHIGSSTGSVIGLIAEDIAEQIKSWSRERRFA